MNTAIARFSVLEGKEEEALAVLRKMVSAVQANEPGALAYICHRSRQNPSEIVFFEVYRNDEASRAHGETPHMREFAANFAQIFDASQVKIDLLERVDGFVRAEAG